MPLIEPFRWDLDGNHSGDVNLVPHARRTTIARHLRAHLKDVRSPVVRRRVLDLIEKLDAFTPNLPYWADCD